MSKFSAAQTYALFESPANRKIIRELEVIGAQTILFPALETRAVSNEAIADLSMVLKDFDWLVFTDVYAVEFFLRKLEECGFDFFELDELRVCAFGESVADRLRFAQLHADIIPNSIKPADVLRALKDYFSGDAAAFETARFLILKEQTAQLRVTQELQTLGAHARELAIYETIAGAEAETAKLKTLLLGGAIDEFIFTSPFDVTNLAHLFPAANLAEVLAETKIVAADNITAQSIAEARIVES